MNVSYYLTDVWIAIFWFIISLIASHIMLICKFDVELKDWPWKAVDYVYLILAFGSVMGYAEKSRNDIFFAQRITIENTINIKYGEISSHASSHYYNLCLDRDEVSKSVIKLNVLSKEDYCKKMKDMLDYMRNNLDSRLPIGVKDASDNNANYLSKELWWVEDVSYGIDSSASNDQFISNLIEYNKAAFEYKNIKANTSGNFPLITYLAPILLSTALALRVTKVTAELKRDGYPPFLIAFLKRVKALWVPCRRRCGTSSNSPSE